MSLNAPPPFLKAFAASGSKNSIPQSADTATGKAGFDVGFPPVTMIPKTAGGIPPWGQDFNGILFDVTTALQYLQSGKPYPFNQEFSTAVGGYAKDSIIIDSSGAQFVSLKNNNADATTVSASWRNISFLAPTETTPGLPVVAAQAVANAGTDISASITPKTLAGVLALRQKSIGDGQTLQDLTSSRAKGVTYTNATGRTIVIQLAWGDTNTPGVNYFSIDSLQYTMDFATSFVCISTFIIPSGSTYVLTGSTDIVKWTELR